LCASVPALPVDQHRFLLVIPEPGQKLILADKGIDSAAETGVYGSEGKWLIEGQGVDPDIVVDNLPHAPPYPLKAFKYDQ